MRSMIAEILDYKVPIYLKYPHEKREKEFRQNYGVSASWLLCLATTFK
jgi:hypothetical protein